MPQKNRSSCQQEAYHSCGVTGRDPEPFALCMCSVKQLCICLIFFIILYNLEERKASIEFVIYGLIFTCCIRVRDLVQETKRACEPRTKATCLRTKCIFLGALSSLALLGKPTACSPCEGFQAHVLPRRSPSLSLSQRASHLAQWTLTPILTCGGDSFISWLG